MNKRLLSGFATLVGFILSPASWWNDLLVNFPLSYAFAIPFGMLSKRLLIPMFIVGYWLTNILGLTLMHYGVKGVIKPDRTATSPNQIRKMILISILYTGLILFLALTGVLTFPQELIDDLI